ncbi:MAG TPA: TonB family protein [Longimicrobiales bacterium]|nr:TonB family protein [Longimicrobiales bacterium]
MNRPQPNVPELRVIPGGSRGSAAPFVRGLAHDSRERKPSRRAVVSSIALHVLVLGGFIGSALAPREPLPEFIVYRVELVSPPPTEEGPPEPPTRQPEPPRVMEQPQEPAPPEVQPVPVPPPPPPPEEPEPEAQAEPTPARGPEPDPTARVGGENLDIRIDGAEFPYPEYLENIMRQAQRFFGAWTGTRGLSAEVYFVIRRDGSVEGIRILRSSGNFRFDLQAQAAIEAAGGQRAFGPLPQGFQGDALRIAIEFQP